MSGIAQDFVDALGKLERDSDGEALVALFAEDASVSNPIVTDQKDGDDTAKQFWTDYRASFDEIRSTFRHVSTDNETSFLEWQSEGKVDGKSFSYGGVSVIEEKGGQIAAFRTYFDPAKLPVAHAAPGQKTGDAAKNGAEGAKAGEGESDLDRAQEEMAEQRAEGGYS